MEYNEFEYGTINDEHLDTVLESTTPDKKVLFLFLKDRYDF